MLTAGDALAKTLAKSQKVTFESKNIALEHLQQWSKKLNIDAKLKKNQLQQWSNNESKSIASE